VLDLAAREAISMGNYHAGIEEGELGIRQRAETLLERLPGIPDVAYLEEVDYSVGRLKSLVEWLAHEAGIPPETGTVDGSVISPEGQLLERIHTAARYDVAILQAKAEEVQAHILKERRRRVLLDEADLRMIARYEAHLSRQMYQALHELEALQERKSRGAAPLARLDVQT
jgi:endonuclease/exonuclease/phosphatase family metal-dependent hydrolase